MSHKSLFRLSNAEAEAAFDVVIKLREDLRSTSVQILHFTDHYVHLDPKSFDWSGFKAAIDKYTGSDLSFDLYKTTTISQSDATIAQFLLQALGVVADLNELTRTIDMTFTNLKSAKKNGWANFSSSSVQGNSSWEYRVLFALPNEDVHETAFYSLVTTIKLEADIEHEESWWGLQSSIKKNFSAIIDSMRLFVVKGFKDPRTAA
ncbi:Volvatoxin A2 in monoclinic crystal [Guyanagaster necrorhizus]|uniref:Volvatoxin A2 in monoclinic crystal n=1 Tax=Guyanagaster necrorhizus TaxID=856835 RepID=A0A9P8ASZ4_9AGAR|nr:Volvatoxin A2 in monoclinic crystal [Guyanagaster necrorhizus MCA 3950]KAG7446913.1 Volvatoxin A2 in monoclinic crystal [Guyanagaster necrorhizus MCA 3950]